MGRYKSSSWRRRQHGETKYNWRAERYIGLRRMRVWHIREKGMRPD